MGYRQEGNLIFSFAIVPSSLAPTCLSLPPSPPRAHPAPPGERGASSFGKHLEPVPPGASGFHKDWSPAPWVFGEGKMGAVEALQAFQLLAYREAQPGPIRQAPSMTP